MNLKIDVLGTKYTVSEKTPEQDSFLKTCDGYCDKTVKQIVIIKKPSDNELGDFEVYRKKILRHEIIHAFLCESGLHENFQHQQFGQEETVVDWIAIQFPKMLKAFKEAACIES